MKTPTSKKAQKTAPAALVRHAANRTDASLQKIEEGKAVVEQMLITGELAMRVFGDSKKELGQAAFMAICGLGSNFLNADKHKGKTKSDVLTFLQRVNDRLPASLPAASGGTDGSERDIWKIKYLRLEALYEQLKNSFNDGEDAYSRLATRAHHWFLDLREARRENRVLKVKTGMKIVPVPR